MKRFRSILFLLAAALLFGAAPARAYLLAVEAIWWPDDEDAPTLAQASLVPGSIIQIVAYNSREQGVEGFGDDELDKNNPIDNFTHYSGDGDAPYDDDVFIPDSAPVGHHIVASGYIQSLPDYGSPNVYGMTTIINVPDAYDTVYVRVFSATDFEQGVVANGVHWGISDTNHITPTFGTALTWFDDVPAPNIANFELIPEPSSLAFLLSGGSGMGVFALFRRRRQLRPPEE